MIIEVLQKGVQCQSCGHTWVVRSTNQEKKRFQCSKCKHRNVISPIVQRDNSLPTQPERLQEKVSSGG